MYRYVVLLTVALGATACSGSADVDPATALPGTWNCDDEIRLVLKSNGRYEWHVKHDEDYTLWTEDSEVMKMTEEGHVLLGEWRLAGDTLELDMLGETDRYGLTFSSKTRLSMNGPERYSCSRS